MSKKYDFHGWATRCNIKCDDGRTIEPGAFKDDDGQVVPLVWQHLHNSPENVLGHALLEHRADGVYAHCSFNNTEKAQAAKEAVEHGDISSLSIYANKLKQRNGQVLHGKIREVSLVLAGANEGARIDYPVVAHYGEDPDECVIYHDNGDMNLISLEGIEDTEKDADHISHAESDEGNGDKTLKDVINTFNDEQKIALYAMLAIAANGGAEDDTDEDGKPVKHGGVDDDMYNVFDQSVEPAQENTYVLQHSAIHMEAGAELSHDAMQSIIADAKRFGSMRESFIQHKAEYGIDQIDWLFPDYKNLNDGAPEFISRDMEWVSGVMNSVHKTPFSRIKSMFADIREDDARAKGYTKGKRKKEEVFTLLKRTTDPQTIYKKQKFDRDDIIDIIDFDVIAWVKAEMRMMLDEEIARAILVGDGRLGSSEDKIFEAHVRSVYNDDEFYSIKKAVDVAADADEDAIAKATIRAAIKSRKEYKGSGNPTFYTTEDVLTDMLLLEDGVGRPLYDSVDKLKTALRVSSIVTVPVMEGLTRESKEHENRQLPLLGIIVNLRDYNVGSDKGGAVNMFEDFDIDYNQQKYLIETRISGALVKPFSAIVLELNKATA